MKTIFWGNYKGGVGKTTSVFQVGNYFAKNRKRVLLIDLDPQCSLSNICCNSNGVSSLQNFKVDKTLNYIIELYMRFINNCKLFDFSLLTGNLDHIVKPFVINTFEVLKKPNLKGNLFFIPSSIIFENCRLNELAQRMSSNIYNLFLIKLFVDDVSEHFDYIFFDCPPTSNLLIQSVFLASDYYIVPTICDEISTKGVPDYITEIEKTYNKYCMNEYIGEVMLDKVFGSRPKFIGAFETIYKERRGNADNSSEIMSLDRNISRITSVKSIISDDKFSEFRYNMKINGFETKNIFKFYIGHKDNRSGGESIPANTSKGETTPSYDELSKALLKILG
ncbi:MAG: AAA family ATPase [Clostridia bacterium]|nr:AAA family ATPase [Clostridia bacterium]